MEGWVSRGKVVLLGWRFRWFWVAGFGIMEGEWCEVLLKGVVSFEFFHVLLRWSWNWDEMVFGNLKCLPNSSMERITAKIVRRCRRRISKLFYKFPVSTDPIKFTEVELVDDDDLETMVALYRGNWSNQNASIQLFAELADVEPTENLTPLDISLNDASETDAVGDDGYDSSDPSYHKIDSDSGPDMDEVSDDIDDECANDDGNVNVSIAEN
ncbi:hypothetical protein GOBAR_DD32213 [Gossypium barbadense]|nr:hypothetical protein GOBAR_DD32213 [Gossypium barbadense]